MYKRAAANRQTQTETTATKYGCSARSIALIVASGFLLANVSTGEDGPPPGLLKQIAQHETENAQAMSNYTYRQSVTLLEYDTKGKSTGEYRETRDIIFSPTRGRYEEAAGQPVNTLTHIKLTPVDYADIRDIDPFALTADKVSLYQGEYKGEESVDGYLCYVEHVHPKQILAGQRFFDGLIWVRKTDLAMLRTQGQAVPQI